MEQKKVAQSPADAELSACAPRRWVGESHLSHSSCGSRFQLSETKIRIFFSKHFSSFRSANSRVHVECLLFLSQGSLRCVLVLVYQAVQVKVGEAPIPEKNVIDQICSKAEPPELVGKVVWVLRQEGADVFPAQFGTLWRPVFIVTSRVALEGLWDSFALLVVTTKALLSAVALTWISKLLEFGLVKKSFPMVYFTTFSCFRWLWILNLRILFNTCWRSNVVQSQAADK